MTSAISVWYAKRCAVFRKAKRFSQCRKRMPCGLPSQYSPPTGVPMKIVCLALALMLSFLTSCGTGSSGTLSGSWVFNLATSDSFVQATANLNESGNQITGQGTVNQSSCGTSGTVSGNVQGEALTLQLTEANLGLALTGTANQAFTSASGTYEVTGGSCLPAGETGTWSAAFQ